MCKNNLKKFLSPLPDQQDSIANSNLHNINLKDKDLMSNNKIIIESVNNFCYFF